MKTVLRVISALLILTGVVWFFQGIGLLPGSFMTGQIEWGVAGIVAVVVGLWLARYSRRKAAEDSVSPIDGATPDQDDPPSD